jgi:hypothetical protein
MEIQIKSRWGAAVPFTAVIADTTPLHLQVQRAVEAAVGSGAYLRGAYLRDAYLRDAYLSGAYLSGADLSGADLSGASLSGAYLRDAYLRGADLSGAYLSGADLSGAYLRGADLRGADLSGAYLRGAYLRGAYLSGADLSGADLSGADLSGADLRDAYLRGTKEKPKLVISRVIGRAYRSDGYEFIMFDMTDSKPVIRAGCRTFTAAEFKAHVKAEYPDSPKAAETLRIIRFLEGQAKQELW